MPSFRALLGLAFAAAAACAGAQEILLAERMQGLRIGAQVEVLEDPTAALAIADVRSGTASRNFVRHETDTINYGYRSGALWIRMSFESGREVGPWVLEVGYPLLDRVELYGPANDKPWVAGDLTPLSQRVLAERLIAFPITAPDPGRNVYLLRVEQAGSLSVPLEIWDRTSFSRAKRDESFLLGGYYGLLAVMVLYNLFLFALVRDRAYAWYSIYVATMGVVLALNNGFGSLYLWPEAPAIADWAQVAAIPLLSATAAIFTRSYLLTSTMLPAVNRALVAIIVAGLAMVPVASVLPRALVFWYVHVLALATLAAMIWSGVASWHSGNRPARYYLTAFAAVIVGGLFMVARNLGAPANFITDYGIQVGSALEVVLLSMGLADRINSLRREKEQAQGVALESKETLVAALRETERELERRVAERTEMLEALNRSLQAEVTERERTAALLKASEERMRYQAQHDPLTGMPNRWLLRDRLVQATARAKRDRVSYAVLLVDLDNFKTVNDTLGHDVGDLLLTEVAQRLADCIRARDTLARLGGDEFVFVLEELAAPEDSALVARKVIEVLAAPFTVAGELLRTSPSIGISLYPEDGQDPDFLLKFADIAMYRAKSAGRNCYRFYRDPQELHAYDNQHVD